MRKQTPTLVAQVRIMLRTKSALIIALLASGVI
jgi:hypothetical protein